MSLYFAHQPGELAWRARVSMSSRNFSLVTPYKVSRSEMSRSLKPTRPCSILLILEREPRIS
jgi:hypothetical protein